MIEFLQEYTIEDFEKALGGKNFLGVPLHELVDHIEQLTNVKSFFITFKILSILKNESSKTQDNTLNAYDYLNKIKNIKALQYHEILNKKFKAKLSEIDKKFLESFNKIKTISALNEFLTQLKTLYYDYYGKYGLQLFYENDDYYCYVIENYDQMLVAANRASWCTKQKEKYNYYKKFYNFYYYVSKNKESKEKFLLGICNGSAISKGQDIEDKLSSIYNQLENFQETVDGLVLDRLESAKRLITKKEKFNDIVEHLIKIFSFIENRPLKKEDLITEDFNKMSKFMDKSFLRKEALKILLKFNYYDLNFYRIKEVDIVLNRPSVSTTSFQDKLARLVVNGLRDFNKFFNYIYNISPITEDILTYNNFSRFPTYLSEFKMIIDKTLPPDIIETYDDTEFFIKETRSEIESLVKNDPVVEAAIDYGSFYDMYDKNNEMVKNKSIMYSVVEGNSELLADVEAANELYSNSYFINEFVVSPKYSTYDIISDMFNIKSILKPSLFNAIKDDKYKVDFQIAYKIGKFMENVNENDLIPFITQDYKSKLEALIKVYTLNDLINNNTLIKKIAEAFLAMKNELDKIDWNTIILEPEPSDTDSIIAVKKIFREYKKLRRPVP